MSRIQDSQPTEQKKRLRRDVPQDTTTPEQLSRQQNDAIPYPMAGDSRDKARISYKRKSIDFGKFNTPQSYIMFGLWKLQLMLTGRSVQGKALRPMVDAVMNAEEYKPPKALNTGWFVGALLLGLISLATANYFGYRYYATARPSIDGVPMADMEISSIRKTRKLVMPDPDNPHLPPKPTLEMRRIVEFAKAKKLQALEKESHAKPTPPD